MKHISSAGLALGTLLVISSWSARAQWQQEPDRIFGLKFGERVEDQIPKCDPLKSVVGQPMCWKAHYGTMPHEVWNTGALTGYFNLLDYLDGLPTFEGFRIEVDNKDFTSFLETLTARYGKPTSTDTEVLQTVGGATLKSNRYLWTGQKVNIVLTERTRSNVMRGSLLVITQAYMSAREVWNKKKLDAAKGKL